MAVIISYDREKEAQLKSRGILLVTLLTFALAYPYFYSRHFNEIKTNFAQVNLPAVEVASDLWWKQNGDLPAYNASLFGFPSQKINIEWAGNLDEIRQTLIKQGWTKPPARDWVSTLHRVADISSTEYLPLISPQYLDKRPALTLTRKMNGVKSLLVVRFWDANRILKDANTTLWVGVVSTVPRPYGWIFKKHPGDIEIDHTFVIPDKKVSHEWQWKIVTITESNGNKKPVDQNILLVRKNMSATHKKK
jgi:hypothetical protein